MQGSENAASLENRFCLGSSMVEQLTLNQLVCGSSPHRGTILNRQFLLAVFHFSAVVITGCHGVS